MLFCQPKSAKPLHRVMVIDMEL